MRKLLIADCNEDYRAALAAALSSQYHVLCSRTGTEALALLYQEQPDIFLLDLMLPELDGLTLLERAYADNIRPMVLAATPILSRSGWMWHPPTAEPSGFMRSLALSPLLSFDAGIKFCNRKNCTKRGIIICDALEKYLTSSNAHAIMPKVKENALTRGGSRWTHLRWFCCWITTAAC